MNLERVQSTEIMVELGNITTDMAPMPVWSDLSGNKVQLRSTARKSGRRMHRPIGIIGDMFAMKRNSAPKLSLRDSASIDDFEIPKSKPPPKNKKSSWNRTRNEKYLDSNWVTKQELSSGDESLVENEVSSGAEDEGFGAFVAVESFDKIFDSNDIMYVDNGPCSPKGNKAKLELAKKTTTQRADNIDRKQSHLPECISKDDCGSPADILDFSHSTFFTFGKIGKIDENGYAVMRPIMREQSIDRNDHRTGGSFHLQYVSIFGNVNSKRNAVHPGRKQSFDRCSSGFGSDTEEKCTKFPTIKQLRFVDIICRDEAISLKYDSSVPSSHHTSSGSLAEIDPNVFKTNLVASISNRLLGQTDIRRPNIIKADTPTVPKEKIIFKYPEITGTAPDLTSQTKSSTKKLFNRIYLKLQSKTMPIRQTWRSIRENTETLVKLPQSLLNFV